MSEIPEEAKKALEELKEVTERLSQDPVPEKFVQIILQDGLPQVNFNGMTIAEVLGTLKLTEALIVEKQLIKEVRKQNIQKALELDLL